MPFAFEKLIVYQKAIDVADRICKLADSFPRSFGLSSERGKFSPPILHNR